jgi:hypothetical protein
VVSDVVGPMTLATSSAEILRFAGVVKSGQFSGYRQMQIGDLTALSSPTREAAWR